MRTIILAGGFGTRLAEETDVRPKPMVEIGGRPMLLHIMSAYAAFGFDDFVVACGYKADVIVDYFRSHKVVDDWKISLRETGLDTLTGGRLLRLRDVLREGTFMVSYGDGLADVDISALVAFHRRHGRLATVTAVHPPARFGALDLAGNQVTRFAEKASMEEAWINGGFFVFEPPLLDYIADDGISLEKDVLERVASDGELMAFRHEGFFQPMDTLREKRLLEELWRSGDAPWAPERLIAMGRQNSAAEQRVITPLRVWYGGRRVFVTGHTGFKGAWLLAWLRAAGCTVAGYALPPEMGPRSLYVQAGAGEGIRSWSADIRDGDTLRDALETARPEIVIHLAAQAIVRQSYAEPVATFETNVMGTARLLDALRHVSTVRAVVVVSSDKCYDNRGRARGYREDEALGGRDPYSASKGAQEMVAAAFRHSFLADAGIAVATARAGNVIGGGDWGQDRLLPDLMRAAASGQSATVRNPAAIRPWQFVAEPLLGYLRLAQALVAHGADFAEAWNFGPPAGDSVGDVVELVSKLWPAIRIETAPGTNNAPYEAPLLLLDSAKAAARLGWRTVLTTEEAVALALDGYRAIQQGPAPGRSAILRQWDMYETRSLAALPV